MWSLLILFVLLVTFVFCADDNSPRSAKTAALGVLSFILGVAGTITLIVYSCGVPTISVEDKQVTNIVALSNGSELYGSYFVFAGTLDQKQVYYYFEQTATGGLVQGHLIAQGVVIYQDTIDTGYIVMTRTRKFVDSNYAQRYRGWVLYFSEYMSTPAVTEIHVPPNTISRNFKLDLQNN